MLAGDTVCLKAPEKGALTRSKMVVVTTRSMVKAVLCRFRAHTELVEMWMPTDLLVVMSNKRCHECNQAIWVRRNKKYCGGECPMRCKVKSVEAGR